MDSLSQAALGASIGEVMLGKKIGNKAPILGAIIATIPDLDVLLYSVYSSFDMLRIHRGLSHSIVLSILGGALIAWILTKVNWTKEERFSKLFLFAWLTLITHILLDVFTSYGTQIFLPFSDQRVGFDSVNVVDPVYTIPLLVGVLLSAFYYNKTSRRSFPAKVGLMVSTAYLLVTLGVKSQVSSTFKESLDRSSINFNKSMTMPVGVANINWYGVASGQDSIYIQRYSLIHGLDETIHGFSKNEGLLDHLSDEQSQTMKWFAKGFYCVMGDSNQMQIYNLQVDMRGISTIDGVKVPTMGYFKMTKSERGYRMSSGSHE